MTMPPANGDTMPINTPIFPRKYPRLFKVRYSAMQAPTTQNQSSIVSGFLVQICSSFKCSAPFTSFYKSIVRYARLYCKE